MDGTTVAAPERARRRLTKAIIGVAVLASATVVPFAMSSSAASKPVSVVDYAQCANGQPPSTAVTCTGGWINGILQASNSHFSEGDVTPQRLIVGVNTDSGTCTVGDTSGCHSVTLTYQARKGTTHAYDSLATWNTTVTGADRCLGLTNPVQTALSCPSASPTSTLAITPDPTVVNPFTSASGVTSDHDLAGQLEMYNGTLVAMSQPTHDAASCSGNCGDDYATTTIYYSAPGVRRFSCSSAATSPSARPTAAGGVPVSAPRTSTVGRTTSSGQQPMARPSATVTTRSWGRRSNRSPSRPSRRRQARRASRSVAHRLLSPTP